MNCPNCGTFCEEGARFCPVCGGQLSAEGSDFISLNPMPETASQPYEQPLLPPAEMLIRKNEEETVKRYRGLLIFSLLMAIVLVAGAVYMAVFFNVPEDVVSETDVIVEEESGIVGSWVNDDGYIILTASGKFAADDLKGSYTSSDSLLVMDYGDHTVIAEYVMEEDVLTLTVSSLGVESSYTYSKVTDRTDLTYSQLMEMWKEKSA